MRRHWRTLGIAATTDTRAIRRAYADRLKAGDYDSDADAFMALREARDWALWAAENEELALDEEEEEDEAFEPETDFDPDHGPPDDLQINAGLLEQALFAEREGWPSEDEYTAMRANLDAMVASDRMAEIALHADVENWLADRLASAVPISDPLIEPAAAYFGWDARDGEIGVAPAIDYLLARRRSLLFLDEVQKPAHKHFRAWRELTTPAGEGSGKGLRFGGKRVRELLALVRRDHPDLENLFDGWRVALWENKREPVIASWTLGLFVVIALQVLVRTCSMSADDTSRPAPPLPVEERLLTHLDAGIEPAVRGLSGGTVTIDQLFDENPKLYAALEQRFTDARAKGVNKWDFVAESGDFLGDVLDDHVSRAGLPLLREAFTLRRDRLTYLWKIDPLYCDDLLKGKAPATDPASFAKRAAALNGKLLLDTDGIPPNRPDRRRFTIPDSVFEAAARQAKLSEDRMSRALNDGGDASERCAARIGLIDAALEAPPAIGLPLLRAM